MKNIFISLGGSSLIAFCGANAVFADVSEDRIETYKNNKLIPQEVNISTVNSVSSESIPVAVFIQELLSWKPYSDAQHAAFSKYMDWSKEDFETFLADSANASEIEEVWNALSQIGNNHLQGAAISDEDAMNILQSEFERLRQQYLYSYGTFPAFPCEGIDFTNLYLEAIDFRNCTGITGAQLAATNTIFACAFNTVDFTGVDLSNAYFIQIIIPANSTGLTWDQIKSAKYMSDFTLPNMDLSNADFAGQNLNGLDFSNCHGMTWTQLNSAANITDITLPKLDLTSVDLTGKNLYRVNFMNCTGLSKEQLKQASNVEQIYLTAEQYDTVKGGLPRGTTVYVNWTSTKVPY